MPTFKPEGWPTVTPRIITPEVAAVVGFMRSVFDASGEIRANAPVEARIGDSIIMVSDGGDLRAPMPAFLHVYVADADEAHRRAVDAGARSLENPADMPYGDRRATVRDPWGNIWQVATHRGR